MSKIWLPAGAGDTRSVEDRFLDLLLADDDLVQAEFDAIIAAEWPGPPPNLPRRHVRRRPRPRQETSSPSHGQQEGRNRTATSRGYITTATLPAAKRPRDDRPAERQVIARL